jgi:hypothetical protein
MGGTIESHTAQLLPCSMVCRIKDLSSRVRSHIEGYVGGGVLYSHFWTNEIFKI